MLYAIEGFKHSDTELWLMILGIGTFYAWMLFMCWKNGPALRKQVHKELHGHKEKAKQWLNDPNYYNKQGGRRP